MRGSPDGTDRYRQETLDWLRSAIERLSQFSRETRLQRVKKIEGSCTGLLPELNLGRP